jgi:FkbM family methyltransferase
MFRPLKKALRRILRVNPINATLTNTLRAVLNLVGVHPDFITRKIRRVGPVSVSLPNGRILRFWTGDDDLIPNQIFWLGWEGFEPETLPLFFRLAEQAQLTLDVGAHVGLFSLVAGHANPAGRVVAFEAMPATCRRLEQNVGLNRLGNVECVETAVAGKPGLADFYYNTGIGMPGESSLRRECADAFLKYSSEGEIATVTVPVITIDQFLRDKAYGKVDLVKLDTEGVEPEVLEGMQETIRAHHPHMVCEVLKGFGTEARLETLLAPHGYRFYLLTTAGPVLRDTIEGQPDRRWELRNYFFSTLGPDQAAAIWDATRKGKAGRPRTRV